MKIILKLIVLGGGFALMCSCTSVYEAGTTAAEASHYHSERPNFARTRPIDQIRQIPAEIVGTGLGAAIGAAVLDDKPVTGVAIGALGGYSAVRIANQRKEEKQQSIYNTGYVKGKSDAAKTLYWAQRNAEREALEGDLEYRYMEVPVASHITSDGVKIDEHYRVIEVVE